MSPEPSDVGLIVFAVATGVSAAWNVARRSAAARRELVFTCPTTGSRVFCVVLQERGTNRCIGVAGCSGDNPGCAHGCIELLNRDVPLDAPVPADSDPP